MQRLVHELQVFAGRVPWARAITLTDLAQPVLDAIPRRTGPLALWITGQLMANMLERIDRQFGGPLREDIACLSHVWQADSSAMLRDGVNHYLHAFREHHCARNLTQETGNPRVDLALEYIRSNYSRSSLSLADVSDYVRLSRWHLGRLLVHYAGASFYTIVRGIRMERALVLLRDDRLTVKEIAALLGYAYSTEFDRQFKQSFGLTPTDWRLRRRCAARNPPRYLHTRRRD